MAQREYPILNNGHEIFNEHQYFILIQQALTYKFNEQ